MALTDSSSVVLRSIISDALVSDWVSSITEDFRVPSYDTREVWTLVVVEEETNIEHTATFKQLASAGNKWARRAITNPNISDKYAALGEKILNKRWDLISEEDWDGTVGDEIIQIALFGDVVMVVPTDQNVAVPITEEVISFDSKGDSEDTPFFSVEDDVDGPISFDSEDNLKDVPEDTLNPVSEAPADEEISYSKVNIEEKGTHDAKDHRPTDEKQGTAVKVDAEDFVADKDEYIPGDYSDVLSHRPEDPVTFSNDNEDEDYSFDFTKIPDNFPPTMDFKSEKK